MTITTLYPSQCLLGESPMWHASRKSCFWVDILNGELYEYDWRSKKTQTWHIGDHVSLIIETQGDTVLLAVKGGIISFDLNTGHKHRLVNLDADVPGNRCNDGACDSLGRLWIGTMDTGCKDNAGSLYRIDHNLNISKMIDELTIPNGIVWSLDNERMYFIETMSRCVKSYLFSKQSGEIYFEKIAVAIPDQMGMPDGMTMDKEGMLWIALYGGSGVCRYNPVNGELLQKITLPALHITNCKFVGEQLDHLLITSARENMSDELLQQYPESGNVFLVDNLPSSGPAPNKPALQILSIHK
jgi:sugar lactone lactonase YvrE